MLLFVSYAPWFWAKCLPVFATTGDFERSSHLHRWLNRLYLCAKISDLLSVLFSLQQDDKSSKEVILDDAECPLQIFRDWPADRGHLHAHALQPQILMSVPFPDSSLALLPHAIAPLCCLTAITPVSGSSPHADMLKLLLCGLSGALVFQLKKRPPDYQGRKGRKVDDHGLQGSTSSLPPEKLPYLVELSPGRSATHTTLMSETV